MAVSWHETVLQILALYFFQSIHLEYLRELLKLKVGMMAIRQAA